MLTENQFQKYLKDVSLNEEQHKNISGALSIIEDALEIIRREVVDSNNLYDEEVFHFAKAIAEMKHMTDEEDYYYWYLANEQEKLAKEIWDFTQSTYSQKYPTGFSFGEILKAVEVILYHPWWVNPEIEYLLSNSEVRRLFRCYAIWQVEEVIETIQEKFVNNICKCPGGWSTWAESHLETVENIGRVLYNYDE